MANKDFELKQILPVVVAVAATFVLTFVTGEARAAGCAEADRVDRPSCLQSRRSSTWRTAQINNYCASTKEAHITINKGDDVTLTVRSGDIETYRIPDHDYAWDNVRIGEPTLCCVTTHNCDSD